MATAGTGQPKRRGKIKMPGMFERSELWRRTHGAYYAAEPQLTRREADELFALAIIHDVCRPVNSAQLPAVNTLSEFQRRLLVKIWDGYTAPKLLTNQWGVRFGKLANGVSRSKSASVSRAIRSLETRGFIVRRNDASAGQKFTHLGLTPKGRAMAQKIEREPVNSATALVS